MNEVSRIGQTTLCRSVHSVLLKRERVRVKVRKGSVYDRGLFVEQRGLRQSERRRSLGLTVVGGCED